jgi:hypothetical protein
MARLVWIDDRVFDSGTKGHGKDYLEGTNGSDFDIIFKRGATKELL